MMRFVDLGLFGTERLAVRADDIKTVELNESTSMYEVLVEYVVLVAFVDDNREPDFETYDTLDEAQAVYWRIFKQLNTTTYPVATPG